MIHTKVHKCDITKSTYFQIFRGNEQLISIYVKNDGSINLSTMRHDIASGFKELSEILPKSLFSTSKDVSNIKIK